MKMKLNCHTVNKLMRGFIILSLIMLWCRVLFLEDAMVELDRRIKVISKAVIYLKNTR